MAGLGQDINIQPSCGLLSWVRSLITTGAFSFPDSSPLSDFSRDMRRDLPNDGEYNRV